MALLVTDLERGGTPLRVARLARALRAADVDVSVGCLARLGPVGAQLAREGFDAFACDARSAADLRVLPRLRKRLRARGPEILHTFLVHANVAGRLAAWGLGCIVVGTTATVEVERRWHGVAERWTGGLETAHIVNTAALAEHVRRSFGTRAVHVVHPQIERVAAGRTRAEARAMLGLPVDARLIAWAGRCDPVKRVEVLLAALAMLANTHLALAGDGPEEARWRSLAEKHGVANRVRWLGWQSDLGDLFAAADLLALPSRTEGLPNVVLQAMDFGLPAVCSALPGLALLGDGLRLVDAAERQFAEAFACALRDDLARSEAAAKRAERGKALVRSIAHFDERGAGREMLATYERILGGR